MIHKQAQVQEYGPTTEALNHANKCEQDNINDRQLKVQRYPVTVSWLKIRSMAGSEPLLQEADPPIIEDQKRSSRWRIRWSK